MRYLFSLLLVLAFAAQSQAARIFVNDTQAEQHVSSQEAQTITDMVRDSVIGAPNSTLVMNTWESDYALRPRLMKLGGTYVLTIDRLMNDTVVSSSQMKATSFTDFDELARRTTLAALGTPARGDRIARDRMMDDRGDSSGSSVSAATTSVAETERQMTTEAAQEAATVGRKGFQVPPVAKPLHYFTMGAGPGFARRLQADDLFINLAVGHQWDVNPRFSLKVVGEGNFSTGGDGANFYDLAAGGNWYFMPTANGSGYVTADLGYGAAESALGRDVDSVTIGTGIGYQFLRTETTSLDVLVRYVLLTEEAEDDGLPQIFATRFAVNF